MYQRRYIMTVHVTGIGAVSTFGFGIEALAGGLRHGRTGVRRLQPGEWPDLTALRWAAPAPDLSDPELHQRVAALLPPVADRARKVLRGARRSLGLGVLAAAEALAMTSRTAAGDDEPLGIVVAGSNLFAGYAASMAAQIAGGAARPDARYGFAGLDSHAVGVLSDVFGARGAGMTVGAASASGLVAVVAAMDMLAAGRASACLVVGLPVDFGPAEWAGLDLIGGLADERRIGEGPASRPFDTAASGFLPGEAAAALVLEQSHSTTGLARIAAAESMLDGTHLPAPTPCREIEVMQRALAAANMMPSDIGLISAHATSTPLGDRVEADAIATVFADAPGLLVNAAKGLIGHAVNAAGLIETVATLIQMRGGFVHPNIGLLDPVCPLPYAGASTVSRPVRRAMKTAFGFGGFNAALILEAA
jgi:malonyl-ACP decarboxylase